MMTGCHFRVLCVLLYDAPRKTSNVPLHAVMPWMVDHSR